jgi:hypothetical protein
MAKFSAYILETICKSHSIVGYLESKGFYPTRSYGDKSVYICPLPTHQDTKPSFIVYGGEQESYFCFGCKGKGNFLSLYAALEQIPWKTAVGRLCKDVDSSPSDEIDYILKSCREESSKEAEIVASNFLESISLHISSLGYMHFVKCDKDPNELKFLEKLYRLVDEYIWGNDVAGLIEAYEFLTNKEVVADGHTYNNPMEYHYLQWLSRKDDMQMKEATGKEVLFEELGARSNG